MIPIWLPAVGVSLMSGFYAGYSVKSTIVEAKEGRALTVKNEQLSASKDRNVALVKELVESKTRVKVVHEIIEKEIPIYIPEKRNCNLTTGAVSLLQQASTGDLSRATTRTSESVRETSNVTEQQLAEYTVKLLKRIHDDRTAHNTLVNWHLEGKR